MTTEKRQRQKEGRLSRLEQQRDRHRRDQRVRHVRTLVLLVLAVVGVALLISLLGRDRDEAVTGAADREAADPEAGGADRGPDALGEAREFAFGTTACPPEQGAPRRIDFEDSFQRCIDPAASYTATFETSAGTVVVRLDTDATPGTANNFVALARYGYYDGTKLFRTDPTIGIIQGGSPTTNSPADPGPGFTIPDEGAFTGDPEAGTFTGPYRYRPGQLVMARAAGADSAGAQFFFTVTEAAAALDRQGTYVVFGEVIEGLDVLEGILASHRDDPGNPLGGAPDPPVTLESVRITSA